MQMLSVSRCGFPVSKVRFHPTKPFFICGSATDNSLLAFTWDSRGTLTEPSLLVTESAKNCIFDLAFHPFEELVAVAENNKHLALYPLNYAQGVIPQLMPETAVIPPPRSRQPFSGEKPELLPPKLREFIDRWNSEDDNRVYPFCQVVFSPEGSMIIGHYSRENQGAIIDAPSRTFVGTFWGAFECLRFHPEGKILATVDRCDAGSELRFLKISDTVQFANVIVELPSMYVGALAFDGSGCQFAVLGGHTSCDISVHRFPDCSRKFTTSIPFAGSEPPWVANLSDALWGWADNLVFSGDGRHVYSPGPNGEIVSIDAEKGEMQGEWKAHEQYIMSLDVHTKLPFLVSGGADGQVCLWEFEGPEQRLKPNRDELSQAMLEYVSFRDLPGTDKLVIHRSRKPLRKKKA